MSPVTPSRAAWLTLAGSVPQPRRVCISIPGGAEWIAELRGAVLLLTKAYNFEPSGDLTPDDMSDAWTEALSTLSWCVGGTMPIGSVFHFAGPVLPAYLMYCDGRTLLEVDYPDLFAVIGVAYGSDDPGEFKLPDLRWRVLVGLDTLGTIGGEFNHQLSTSELPSHSHDTRHLIGAVGVNYAGEYSSRQGSGAAAGWYTMPSGGGEAHNNMQPYLTMTPVIVVSEAA